VRCRCGLSRRARLVATSLIPAGTREFRNLIFVIKNIIKSAAAPHNNNPRYNNDLHTQKHYYNIVACEYVILLYYTLRL